jgi:hypothetical protein
MYYAKRIIASLVLSAALVVPVATLVAAPQDRVTVRVYDRKHKDYHNWDDKENHAWGAYLNENHKKSHEFEKSNRREQENYWNWRHRHPDDRR